MLQVQHLSVSYGVTEVLRDVSFTVPERSIVALLGGNGSGKTTTLNVLSGLLVPRGGAIRFEGQPIAGLPTHEIVKRGIVQVPQGREVWSGMSVRDNLDLGAVTRRDRRAATADVEDVFTLFPVLRARQSRKAGTLSGGEQQMLAIGRALMARPRLLLLDEPSLGLAPRLVEEIFRVLGEIHGAGTTILLAEQNAWLTFGLANYCYLLEVGRVAAAGPSAEVARDERIVRIYLGSETTIEAR